MTSIIAITTNAKYNRHKDATYITDARSNHTNTTSSLIDSSLDTIDPVSNQIYVQLFSYVCVVFVLFFCFCVCVWKSK